MGLNVSFSSTPLCYPRAEIVRAQLAVDEIRVLPDLSDVTAAVDLPNAEYGGYYEMRLKSAGEPEIRAVREVLLRARDEAVESGRPDQARVLFDQLAGPRLHETMNIVRADAVMPGVWSWLHAFAVPDLLIWRFGSPHSDRGPWTVTPSRIHTRQKGLLSRLWWRVELLGPDVASAISEDEAVALVERTSVIGFAPFARVVGTTYLKFVAEQAVGARTELLRDVMKRILRTKSAYEVAVMSESAMVEFVTSMMEASVTALTRKRG